MFKKIIFTFLLGILSSASYAQINPMEGVEYKPVASQEDLGSNEKKVIEFFYYGCPHCYNLEPSLNQWKKTKSDDVVFERIPANFGKDSFEFMAKVFYTAKFLGIEDKFHGKYYEALHKHKKQIFSIDSLVNFVKQFGIDGKEYKNMFGSFKVSSAVLRAKKLTVGYKITGVPSIVVNDKYITDVPMATSEEDLWVLVNHFVKR